MINIILDRSCCLLQIYCTSAAQKNLGLPLILFRENPCGQPYKHLQHTWVSVNENQRVRGKDWVEGCASPMMNSWTHLWNNFVTSSVTFSNKTRAGRDMKKWFKSSFSLKVRMRSTCTFQKNYLLNPFLRRPWQWRSHHLLRYSILVALCLQQKLFTLSNQCLPVAISVHPLNHGLC